MKAKTIGYYKNVQNVGDVNAAVDLKVGMGVVLNRAARTANLPASEEKAKACFRIVSNINDKPEMRNFEETLTGQGRREGTRRRPDHCGKSGDGVCQL